MMIDLACAHQPAGVRAVFKFVIVQWQQHFTGFDVHCRPELIVKFKQVKEVGADPWYCRPHEMTYYLPLESLAAVEAALRNGTVFEVEVVAPMAFAAQGAPVIQPLELTEGGQ
jgi:hypothetical protein